LKKELKELINSLSHDGSRRELLQKLLEAEFRSLLKDLLEGVAIMEREAFCEGNGAVGNGYYSRGLDGLFGRIENLRVPRTRGGGFRPFFIEPYQRVSWQLEELVVAMYQGGCSTRDISRTISALVDGRYSPPWISRVTEVIQEKVEAYRKRPLSKWYPIVFIDGVVIKVKRGSVDGEVVYVALGIDEDGHKEVLGFWLGGAEGESSEIWTEILCELRERGLNEPLLFVGDGLRGLPGAVKELYPRADFQSCLLHKVRGSLLRVRRRHREALKEDLKRVYRQRDEIGFRQAFEEFKREWGKLYPEVVASWQQDIEHLVTYLKYPEEIRQYIYTTNALERFIKEVKRRSKVIEVFPGPDACAKVLYLVAREMNDKYQRRTLRDFSLVKEDLLSIRRGKYGQADAVPEELSTVSHTQDS